ncbi:MAG: hypothetical protein QG646_612 [Euryarchaeota archaeon]|nr:hypothetical protein [Euryarchaeota archaeon]
MSQVFLLYSRHDDEVFVKQLYEDLTKNRIDVWWDRKTMECRGRTFLQELRDAIWHQTTLSVYSTHFRCFE